MSRLRRYALEITMFVVAVALIVAATIALGDALAFTDWPAA